MKDCKKVAKTLLSRPLSVAVSILNLQLTPIEAALVTLHLLDEAGDYQKEVIFRQLACAQEEHFVVDINGRVQLVYDSLRDAEERAEQLGGAAVISGASK